MNHTKRGNLVHVSSYVSKEELQKIKKAANKEVVSTSGMVRKLIVEKIKN